MKVSELFFIRSNTDFTKKSLAVFRLQAKNNEVYREYLKQLKTAPEKINTIEQIPFLPVEFFKTHKISTEPIVGNQKPKIFLSSGTTRQQRSKHYVSDLSIYEKSFRACFKNFYGDITNYAILALLPSYYENKDSSLLYMAMDMIKESKHSSSGFFYPNDETLEQSLKTLLSKKQKVLLLGVSFALLDLHLQSSFKTFLKKNKGGLIIMETGGMKGRREELTREELHQQLCFKFEVDKIHSEYGMTELLSQAYSKGNGLFHAPSWMKVFIHDIHDPFTILSNGQTGTISIIDLANINSCSFVATQDIGKIHKNGVFEVLGRSDNSDLRGCNLLMA